MAGKVCSSCRIEKDLSDFGKHRQKPDGLNYSCLECTRRRDYLRYEKDREKRKQVSRNYYKRTKELNRESRRIYYKEYMASNPEDKAKEKYIKYYSKHKDKAFADSAKRRAYKEDRTVSWDKELTDFLCKEAYSLSRIRKQITGFSWHVDHIIPLKGKLVSGLHIWNNLQLLPATLNLSKGNRI